MPLSILKMQNQQYSIISQSRFWLVNNILTVNAMNTVSVTFIKTMICNIKQHKTQRMWKIYFHNPAGIPRVESCGQISQTKHQTTTEIIYSSKESMQNRKRWSRLNVSYAIRMIDVIVGHTEYTSQRLVPVFEFACTNIQNEVLLFFLRNNVPDPSRVPHSTKNCVPTRLNYYHPQSFHYLMAPRVPFEKKTWNTRQASAHQKEPVMLLMRHERSH
ncbi:Hypothetical_protein [Hexamita inflata]|uniref:Hypothetical_protein n=1 Tax=Hexamita inflata TaxID=28002 RepID=A0AA86N9P4_9EUKA|nr:Hypothetical protein HINF_LOCUS3309 [Hexamita inflata]